MRARSLTAVTTFCLQLVGSVGQAQTPAAAAELAGIVKAFLSPELVLDWKGIEQLPGITWAAVPPTMLQNCLPDGGCFARQGRGTVAGRNLTTMASGARTIVSYVYLRNGSAAFGEGALLEALKEAGFTASLARCPARTGAGGTNWYRLTGEGREPGVLSVQTSCSGRPCEGFVLSRGEELPALQANQVSLYSEQCAAGAERKPVATGKPHEVLAEAIIALVPSAQGAVLDWKALAALPAGITWNEGEPLRGPLSHLDSNPMYLSGSAAYAGRKFSATATGTATEVKAVYLEENGMHARGEHLLGVVYEKARYTIQLVRCGPVYTASTNNWYRITGNGIRPVTIRQSIRYEDNQVQDSYALRLDGSLPARDPRDRDPGVNNCR